MDKDDELLLSVFKKLLPSAYVGQSFSLKGGWVIDGEVTLTNEELNALGRFLGIEMETIDET